MKSFPFSAQNSEIESWARENGWTGDQIQSFKHDWNGYTGQYSFEEFKFLDEEGNVQCICLQDGPV